MDALLEQALSLGVAGLLFVMWWSERQERIRKDAQSERLQSQAELLAGVNDRLIEVVCGNTEALVGLQAELRAQREIAPGWVVRLSQQLERLGANPFGAGGRASEAG